MEVRAVAVPAASDKRSEDRGCTPQRTAGEIRDLHARELRCAVGGAGHREHASERDVIEIVAGAVRVRTGLAVAADRAQDDLWIARGERLVVCLLYTSDAADEEDSVDLGGRRIIK